MVGGITKDISMEGRTTESKKGGEGGFEKLLKNTRNIGRKQRIKTKNYNLIKASKQIPDKL